MSEETISDYSLSPYYLSPFQDGGQGGDGYGDEDRDAPRETIKADAEASTLG